MTRSEDEHQDQFLELEVKGFRRLQEIKLDLRPLCVLIGANGVGKTSVLDVLSLLASSASGKLSRAMSELGGFTSLLTLDHGGEMELAISRTTHSSTPLEYAFKMTLEGLSYRIENEALLQQKTEGYPRFLLSASGSDINYFAGLSGEILRAEWTHDERETALSQVPKTLRETEDFRRGLASAASYHILDVGPRSPVRLPQQVQPSELPGPNGEELISCLYNLREGRSSRFEAIEDALRAAFPRFERMEFRSVAAGTLALAWHEKDRSQPFFINQLSEGTVRFLWLTTLLQSPGLTALTLIDEPEISLHPELLSLLVGLLREAARRTQIIVATHSDRLIRFLAPDEVVTMNISDDGITELCWADQLDLERWLEDYTLDELWRHGRIGARA